MTPTLPASGARTSPSDAGAHTPAPPLPPSRVAPRSAERPFDRLLGFAPALAALVGLAFLLTRGFSEVPSLASVSSFATRPIVLLIALETFHLLLMSALWQRYRPAPDASDDALPTLTVIIPAYNEGPMVERSIRSACEADYPKGKLEVVVVDDGSRDDTFFHMENLRRAYPDLIKLIRFRGNQGKRAALRAGFEAAKGEVVMTIDSDSEVERGTLRSMASPFLEAKVGGVAGWVRVLNRSSWMGRMLDVQFTLSFDFVRAAQSTFGTVFVCPGALSAVRRSVVLPRLEEWVNQSFLGRPVNHGEDQALTNIILRAGYDTVYQRTGVVWTLVPERYRQLHRMLTRWDRSYVVEGLSFARFMFTKYRERGRVLPIVGFVASTFRLVYVVVGLVALPGFILREPFAVFAGLGAGFAIATMSSLYYLRAERSLRFLWGPFYAVYSFLALQWILPYAILTVRDERWGTR